MRLRTPLSWSLAAGALLLPLGGLFHAVGLALATWLVVGLWTITERSPRSVGRARATLGIAWSRTTARLEAYRGWGAGALLLSLLIAPLALDNYVVDVLTLAFLYVVLALGLQITVGFTGLLDLGYASFYAVGAYGYALASTRWGLPFWAGLPLGAVLASGTGVVLGVVTLRLRGDYLAIVTLGFVQIIHLVLNNWDSVTNGPNGILNVGRPRLWTFFFQVPAHFYYLMIGFAAVAFVVNHRLQSSRIGRAWMAIRDDEVAAQAMGVPTTRLKILAFATSAAWAGVAGVCFAGKFAFVSPESFTFFESIVILAMVVLGGMSSIPGVVLGAVAIIVIPELLRGIHDYRMLVFGAALVLMMAVRPEGLVRRARPSKRPATA